MFIIIQDKQTILIILLNRSMLLNSIYFLKSMGNYSSGFSIVGKS